MCLKTALAAVGAVSQCVVKYCHVSRSDRHRISPSQDLRRVHGDGVRPCLVAHRKTERAQGSLESDDGADDEESFEAALFEENAEKVLRDEDFTEFTEYEEGLEEDDEEFLKSILGG